MISVSSVVSALLFYTLILVVVCVLYKCVSPFIANGGAFILLLVAAVATIRLLLPIELSLTHEIRSWNLLGIPVRFLRSNPNITEFLVVVWVTGAVVFLIWDLFDLYRTYKAASEYHPDEEECARVREIAERLSIHCPVVVSSNVPMAYAGGLIRHTIYLPILKIPDEEIEFILNHEAQHIRNHDSTIKFAFRILRAIMWWNLATHWFWNSLDDMLELRCDAKIMEGKDDEQREQYADMLKGLWTVMTGEDVDLDPTIAVSKLFKVNRKEFMNQRTYIIKQGTGRPPRWASTAVSCVLVVLFCASYLIIFQPASDAPAESLIDEPEVYYHENYDGPDMNDRSCGTFIYKGSDGRYQLFVDYVFNRYLSEDEVNSSEYKDFYFFKEEKQE